MEVRGTSMQGRSGASADTFKDRLLNLSTSNREVATIIEKAFSEESSPADQQKVVAWLNLRNQMTEALSNTYRIIFDGMSAIIRNLRA